MNNEIKEINIPENVLIALGDLTNGALNYYKVTETVKVRYNTILDYITNLQEENEELEQENINIKQQLLENKISLKDVEYKEKIKYKSRCEKAIAYIKIAKTNEENDNMKDYIYTKEDLLNILNGDDKSEYI